jgi:hypothetical protein
MLSVLGLALASPAFAAPPTARNVNALTSERLTDIGGGPTFYTCLVEVERCGD